MYRIDPRVPSEAALHGPRGKRGTGECVFFLVHPQHRHRDHGSFSETGTGHRHASVYVRF